MSGRDDAESWAKLREIEDPVERCLARYELVGELVRGGAHIVAGYLGGLRDQTESRIAVAVHSLILAARERSRLRARGEAPSAAEEAMAGPRLADDAMGAVTVDIVGGFLDGAFQRPKGHRALYLLTLYQDAFVDLGKVYDAWIADLASEPDEPAILAEIHARLKDRTSNRFLTVFYSVPRPPHVLALGRLIRRHFPEAASPDAAAEVLWPVVRNFHSTELKVRKIAEVLSLSHRAFECGLPGPLSDQDDRRWASVVEPEGDEELQSMLRETGSGAF